MAGKPVPYFGIAASPSFSAEPLVAGAPSEDVLVVYAPTAFYSRTGAYELPVQAGRWDLVVCGPGFARHVVRNLVISDSALLADIEVQRGAVINGQVSDENGNPVSDAIVSVIQEKDQADGDQPNRDPLLDSCSGNFRVLTDSNGLFVIEDFRMVRGSAQLIASVPQVARSIPYFLSGASVHLNVRLLSVGSVHGHVGSAPARNRRVMAQSIRYPDFRVLVHPDHRGDFYLRDLPAGEYDIGVLSQEHPPLASSSKRVFVLDARETSVSLP